LKVGKQRIEVYCQPDDKRKRLNDVFPIHAFAHFGTHVDLELLRRNECGIDLYQPWMAPNPKPTPDSSESPY
jgi:hypothetical protein